MVSTAMMASSTRSPNARMRVPSETLCNPMLNRYMNNTVPAKTNGIEMTTTIPVRSPRLMRLTTRTMPIASATASTKSSTERLTAAGMLAT